MNEEIEVGKPDLLGFLFSNRIARNLIAVAVISFTLTTIYNAGKSFIHGFREGFAAASNSSKVR